MIDGHIHYAASLKEERLLKIIEQYRLSGIALQCIPKAYKIPVEQDAFLFKRHCPVPVYIFGNLNLTWKEKGSKPAAIARQLMEMGCTGIKMLEGKPIVRKFNPIPDFDCPEWEEYWAYLEQQQIPVYMHVNDPPEFWDEEKVSEFAKSAGWFYDDTYIHNEEQYRQILTVLERHPKLRILFPHFFFMSGNLARLGRILDTYSNVYLDITPCVEMYFDLSGQQAAARQFFQKYQNRICFGTDIGARSVICEESVPLSIPESQDRVALITRFLEDGSEYVLRPNYYYQGPGDHVMHGLGLSRGIRDRIYETNFLHFCRVRGAE